MVSTLLGRNDNVASLDAKKLNKLRLVATGKKQAFWKLGGGLGIYSLLYVSPLFASGVCTSEG